MKQKSLEEVIVGMKNKYKTGTYGNIYSGVYIEEILYEFQEVPLFGEKATIMLPLVFSDMPEEIAKAKYPNSGRPQIIKMNSDGSINCCFSILEQKLDDEGIETTANEIKDILKKLHLTEAFLMECVETTSTNKFSWFTYKNNTLNGALFNHMFITTVNGNMVQGMFNCPYREMDLWKMVMKEMMLTLREHKE